MKKRKIILYSIFAVIVVAAVVYFLCNPISAEEIEAILPQNEWWSAAILLVLFVMKGFIPVILYAILVTACGALFDLPYAILLASIGTVITFTISYLIGKTAKADVNRMIETHEMLKIYYVKGEKYSFVFSLALHAVGLSSELLGAFFGSVGMAYVPYLVSSIVGVLPGTAMWLVLGDQKSIFTKEGLIIFLIDCTLVASSFLYLKHRDKKKAEKAAKSVSGDSEK